MTNGSNRSLIFKERAEMEAAPSSAPQPFLFSDETIERITDAEKHGEYTLERLHKLRPDTIPEIIRLRGQWVGKLRIAKMVGIHHLTVSAVEAVPEYAEAIDIARLKRVAFLRSAGDKLVELIDQNPESVPPQVRALAASQLYDKAELMDGRANVRTESVVRVDLLDGADWERFLVSKLPSADVREIDSETGSEDRNNFAIEDEPDTLSGPSLDRELADQESFSEVKVHDVTAFAPSRR